MTVDRNIVADVSTIALCFPASPESSKCCLVLIHLVCNPFELSRPFGFLAVFLFLVFIKKPYVPGCEESTKREVPSDSCDLMSSQHVALC